MSKQMGNNTGRLDKSQHRIALNTHGREKQAKSVETMEENVRKTKEKMLALSVKMKQCPTRENTRQDLNTASQQIMEEVFKNINAVEGRFLSVRRQVAHNTKEGEKIKTMELAVEQTQKLMAQMPQTQYAHMHDSSTACPSVCSSACMDVCMFVSLQIFTDKHNLTHTYTHIYTYTLTHTH